MDPLNTFNFSTYFILPIINYRYSEVGKFFKTSDSLFVFNDHIDKEEKNKYLVTVVMSEAIKLKCYKQYKRGDLNVYIIEIDDIFKDDYLLFKQSQFSKISDNTKSLIINFWKMNFSINHPSVKFLYSIFNKDERIFEYWENLIGCSIPRTQEVMPVLGEKEIFF